MSPTISRYGAKLSAPRSHLRQVTTGQVPSIAENHGSDTDESGDNFMRQSASNSKPQSVKYVCNLNIHDAVLSKENILVDMRVFDLHNVVPGDLMRIKGIQGSSHNQYSHEGASKLLDTDGRRLVSLDVENKSLNDAYLFHVKPMPSDMLAKMSDLQISISSQMAAAFHLAKGSQVVLTPVDKAICAASHVEITFRDQYLARADMWHVVRAELADKCLYRGQRIVFQGNIKASIRSVYINGRKAPSAHFSPSTKPIFRSESARYVLFVQMSKEMWEFDAEGSGEIMFDKVINGFLPDLFKRWEAIQAKHLLSIILFSRMAYNNSPADERNIMPNLRRSSSDENSPVHIQDFYRVVVSDMPSGESADILDQLKREFKVFLRDTSLRKSEAGSYAPIESGLSGASSDMHSEVISGRPTIAAHGNILEAINLASSQFSADYIDRDLVRTGVSVVVISPGTGLFEVDYDLLAATTDNLIENGVGIDLVCLSRMPLHSVPLFQYKSPHRESKLKQGDRTGHTPSSFQSIGTISPSSLSPGSYQTTAASFGGWSYAIPHWIDVSFWTSMEEDQQYAQKRLPKSKLKPEELHGPRHKPFIPRVKIYELQMMGAMENSERDISIPQLLLGEDYAPSRLNPPAMAASGSRATSFQSASISSFEIKTDQSGLVNPHLSASPRSNYSKTPAIGASAIRRMDEYDDALFRHPKVSRRRRVYRRPKQKVRRETHTSGQSALLAPRRFPLDTRADADEDDASSIGSPDRANRKAHGHNKSSLGAPLMAAGGRPGKSSAMPRSISFSLRGLTPKATPTVTAQVDVTQSPAWTAKTNLKGKNAGSISTLSERKGNPKSAGPGVQSLGDQDYNTLPSSDSDRQDSRPIPIRNTDLTQVTNAGSIAGSSAANFNLKPQVHDRVSALSDMRDLDSPRPRMENEETLKSVPPMLSPRTTLAPWLTILNPSNPSKTKLAETSRLGRWQHAFPRAPKSSQMKWKSLCSPAAVPLTTEEFPTPEELEEEYRRDSYIVTLPEEMDLSEQPHSLIHELIAFRLSRGFQIVVGERLAGAQLSTTESTRFIFSEKILGDLGSTLLLSRGSTIHRLSRSSIDRVDIEVLTRHSSVVNEDKAEEKPMVYTPSIRSMLADTYEKQNIVIAPQRGSFNWDMIDAFLAGHERPQAAHFVEILRPWRARFVLIPVDPPSNTRRTIRPTEDSEEEIRLEGINKLTQLWQRFRFVPPEQTGFQSQRKSKDPNPLAISYQTKDPSAVIAAELESVLEGDETGGPVQLLPEPDLYQRSNLNLRTLAETLQGEKGVRMLDRRWHLRLHYSCFIGFELTTWLLQNFRDVESREEAEQLGKELMGNGLFRHVEQRHDFRDGNYFYQIESDYRTPRIESKGWFGRAKSSVPSTPLVEKAPPESAKTTRSRASSNADSTPELQNSISTEKKQKLRVALSKSLLYDVDHRRRSYRRELINLHFDRLHNPDNCYHIRIEWMNTTPRLIQEAVVSWATNVERYGLRLVEVPIGEASSITAMHPFRAPYMVKLAQAPPTTQPRNFFDTTAFVPQPKTDPLFYQKAIVKHFNFVLDFEAASAFPPDVEVTHSWGQPDYRYPQYIHRSGVLIAQITDEGHFLLLANRLYNNRSANATPSSNDPQLHISDAQRERPSNPHHISLPRTAQRSPSRPSPLSSPAVRPTSSATLDIPPTPTANRSGPSPPYPTSTAPTFLHRPGAANTTLASPEKITRDFQTFCSSPAALDAFYNDLLSKSTTPATTPFLTAATASTAPTAPDAKATSTPLLATPKHRITTPLAQVEGEIPNLDLNLGESVFGGGKSLTSPPGSATVAARRERERERAKDGLRQDVKDAMKAEMRRVETKRLSGGGWESPGTAAADDAKGSEGG